jgi:uncharacterized RDD family membrane protein YckC
MEKRSLLDEIEDLNFAIHQHIHKGRSMVEVIESLKKRGVSPEKIEEISLLINKKYQGVSRILCSKSKRAINFLFDFLIVIGISVLIFLAIPSLTFKGSILFVLLIGIIIVYLIPESLWGQTPGKLITNTVVVNEEGKIPSFSWILVRSILRYSPYHCIVSAFLNDRPKHDVYSRTYVVSKKRWNKLYPSSEMVNDGLCG